MLLVIPGRAILRCVMVARCRTPLVEPGLSCRTRTPYCYRSQLYLYPVGGRLEPG